MSEMKMPRFEVGLAGHEPMTVVVPNGVQVQWELERQRKNYPATEDAPITWGAYVTWAAARKAGQIDARMPFEAYTDILETLDFLEPVDADPTPGAPEEDWSSVSP